MKFITFLLILFALNGYSQDETLVWEKDVKKAAEIAVAEQKPLFLFYTGSDWCGACKKLHNEVFAQPEFQEWAKKNVVLVELDFPRNKEPDPQFVAQNTMMKEMFGISSYPTVVFAQPAKRQGNFYYTKIGNMGYKTGGPETWLKVASEFLSLNK